MYFSFDNGAKGIYVMLSFTIKTMDAPPISYMFLSVADTIQGAVAPPPPPNLLNISESNKYVIAETL